MLRTDGRTVTWQPKSLDRWFSKLSKVWGTARRAGALLVQVRMALVSLKSNQAKDWLYCLLFYDDPLNDGKFVCSKELQNKLSIRKFRQNCLNYKRKNTTSSCEELWSHQSSNGNRQMLTFIKTTQAILLLPCLWYWRSCRFAHNACMLC